MNCIWNAKLWGITSSKVQGAKLKRENWFNWIGKYSINMIAFPQFHFLFLAVEETVVRILNSKTT